MTDFNSLLRLGVDYDEFVRQGTAEQIHHLRREQAKTERADFISPPLKAEIAALSGRYTLLVAAEMWCPDCLRNVPALHALCQAAQMPMKIITRDQADPVFKQQFNVEKVAIPFAAILDADLNAVGSFIERPLSVQHAGQDTLNAYKQGERLMDTVEEVVSVIQRQQPAA